MFEGFWSFKYVYLLSVFAVMSVLTIVGMILLKRMESKRLSALKRKDLSEAVETDSPEEDSEKIAKHRAVISVENRFIFIRRLFLPSMALFSIFVMVLPFLTFLPAAYISIFAGAIAVLVGMAARPLIENLFAGLVITFNQPIRVGDTVIIQGRYGTVEDINLLNTIIKVWNWRRFIIPNNKLLTLEYENLSLNSENEWAHISFWVEPTVELEKIRELAKSAMRACKTLSPVEDPSFWVMSLEKEAIECWVAGWAGSPAEAWALKSATRRNLAKLLRENKINYHLNRNMITEHSVSIVERKSVD